MLPGYKSKTNAGIAFGIIIQVVGNIIAGSGKTGAGMIGLVALVTGVCFFLWGCMSYAKGKGHHGAWGILGLFHIIGLIILVFFPDRHKELKA